MKNEETLVQKHYWQVLGTVVVRVRERVDHQNY